LTSLGCRISSDRCAAPTAAPPRSPCASSEQPHAHPDSSGIAARRRLADASSGTERPSCARHAAPRGRFFRLVPLLAHPTEGLPMSTLPAPRSAPRSARAAAPRLERNPAAARRAPRPADRPRRGGVA
jgi:hypothetical protein